LSLFFYGRFASICASCADAGAVRHHPSHPWPFGAGLLIVIMMIIAENFGRGIRGGADLGCGDFADADGGDGGGD
jgi:hypothetical protein